MRAYHTLHGRKGLVGDMNCDVLARLRRLLLNKLKGTTGRGRQGWVLESRSGTHDNSFMRYLQYLYRLILPNDFIQLTTAYSEVDLERHAIIQPI
jgi:hypothetical protein